MSLEKSPFEALVLRRAEEGDVLPRQQTGASPQRLLTTLLGEYWLDNTAALPMSGIVGLLAEFGISETSARATANRLVKRGVLAAGKSGRQSYLRLSDNGREDSRQKTASIVNFGAETRDWDGLWTVVAFSVPEQERHVRHRVRSYLRWLGFAPLFDGLWVSAHADPDAVTAILRAADVGSMTVLRASEAGGHSPLKAWVLEDVAASYRHFLIEQEKTLARVKAGTVSPSDALVMRTKVFDAWRVFPGLDPSLPDKLLPPDWPRAQAREMFTALYDGLAPLAALRFQQIIAVHNSDLAELTERRTTATWTAY